MYQVTFTAPVNHFDVQWIGVDKGSPIVEDSDVSVSIQLPKQWKLVQVDEPIAIALETDSYASFTANIPKEFVGNWGDIGLWVDDLVDCIDHRWDVIDIVDLDEK